MEAQFLDQNISLDKKMTMQEKQEKMYQNFFFEYATEKEIHLQSLDPYHTKIKRLKLRLKNNQYKGYRNAVKRDEVLIKEYSLRQDIRNLMHTVLLQTENTTKSLFQEKVNTLVVDFYSKFKSLNNTKYILSDKNETNTILRALNDAIKQESSLESVSNSFTSALIENRLSIYRTSRIADSKFFTILNTINKSTYGEKFNQYLRPLHLDAAKVLAVLAFILFIIGIIKFMHIIINYFLRHNNLKEEDIQYIHSHITVIFNILAVLLILHLIIVAFIGVDIKSLHITKIFGILYVLIVSILSYRITNTLAYLKVERMKKSKVLKNEVINLSIKVINGLIILIAFVVILKILGVNLTALLSGLGIAGAAVAFAAKDSIANVFGSISILMGDVFEQGDWIETKDVNGTVVEIGLRASTVRTFDNALISIPNFELANSGVKNWSRRRIGRRIKMNLSLTYESKFSDISQAIIAIREMLKEHKGIANQRTEYRDEYRQARLVSAEDFQGVKRTTLVYMDNFSESSIDILVYCFSRTVEWDEWLEVKEDVMFKIADILKKNNLQFAYPTLMVHQVKEKREE
jgi:MscS family membrane protein